MPHCHSSHCTHSSHAHGRSLALHPEHMAPHHDKSWRLGVAFLLLLGFAGLEFTVGTLSHSLVLIADSGHLVSDSLALGIALVAVWLPRWFGDRPSAQPVANPTVPASTPLQPAIADPPVPPSIELGAALINGLLLCGVALWIGWEAIARWQTPPTDIASLPVLLTAIVGVGVNGLNIVLLHPSSEHDLNVKAALLHTVADAFSALGVIIAAIAIIAFNWLWIDGVISLFIAGLILTNTLPLIGQSLKALQNQSPAKTV